MDKVNNELLANLDKLHTTELGSGRIKKNLSLDTEDVVGWCRDKIYSADAIITRNGKNWYVNVEGCIITVNAYNYSIITAHKERKKRTLKTDSPSKDVSNRYQVIDEKTWKRAMHCAVFRNCVEPAFCVTFELDITKFLKKVKESGYSFTMAMIYVVSKCANEIEEFRYRFVDGQVVLFDRIDTAFTYLDKETELFKVVNVPMAESMGEYVATATERASEQKEYFTGPLGNDVFQFSPMPWVSYTHISHTNSGKKDNATPLFDWGKYFEREGKVLLPFSVQAHHSFVDGLHIGKLAEAVQVYLNQ